MIFFFFLLGSHKVIYEIIFGRNIKKARKAAAFPIELFSTLY